MAVDLNYGTVHPVDVSGAMAQGAKENMTVLANDQATRADAEHLQDQAVLKDYAALPDADLFSSEGLKKAQGHLKGRVSMNTYGELVDRTSKLQKSELDYRNSLTKMSAEQRKEQQDGAEQVLKFLTPDIVNDTDPQSRQTKLDEALKAAGPGIHPQVLDMMRKLPQPVLKQLYSSSDFKAKEAKAADIEAQAEERKAHALSLDRKSTRLNSSH